MSQRLTVCGPNLSDQAKGTFHIHAEGCRDLKRAPCAEAIRFREAHTSEYQNLTEVCDEMYPPDEFECESGEYLDEFYFAPCVSLPTS